MVLGLGAPPPPSRIFIAGQLPRHPGPERRGKRPEPPDCERIRCDRRDYLALKEILVAVGAPRIVVDFAAMSPEDIEPVIDAHKRSPLAHYIFISTNMVTGFNLNT